MKVLESTVDAQAEEIEKLKVILYIFNYIENYAWRAEIQDFFRVLNTTYYDSVRLIFNNKKKLVFPSMHDNLHKREVYQTKRNKAKQNETRQNKTKQNKTEQNRSERNGTKRNVDFYQLGHIK